MPTMSYIYSTLNSTEHPQLKFDKQTKRNKSHLADPEPSSPTSLTAGWSSMEDSKHEPHSRVDKKIQKYENTQIHKH